MFAARFSASGRGLNIPEIGDLLPHGGLSSETLRGASQTVGPNDAAASLGGPGRSTRGPRASCPGGAAGRGFRPSRLPAGRKAAPEAGHHAVELAGLDEKGIVALGGVQNCEVASG